MLYPEGYPLKPAVPHRPRWAERITKKRVRLYEPPMMFRTSIVWHIPVGGKHGEYADLLGQVASVFIKKCEDVDLDKLRDKMHEALEWYAENIIGYSLGELIGYTWSEGIEQCKEIPYDEELAEKWKVVIEIEGAIIYEDEGDIDELL